jgi:hypothetical protein
MLAGGGRSLGIDPAHLGAEIEQGGHRVSMYAAKP